jgi:thiol-disulfide isomerase/thioredoxin
MRNSISEKSSYNRVLRHMGAVFIIVLLMLAAAFSNVFASRPEVRKDNGPTLFFFWGVGCPHCAAAKPFLNYLKKSYPGIEMRSFEVVQNKENLNLLEKMANARGVEAGGVPIFIFGNRVFVGYNDDVAREVEAAVKVCMTREESAGGSSLLPKAHERTDSISLPFFGKKDPRALSLPVFTLVIATLDSFNPCAFFVLFTLLSLLVHAHSRKRMVLIGGVFVLTSGLLYFIFMAAWMNLFFLVGHLSAVTWIAGITALIISLINIKDFFFFKKGISLSIPETSKPKLFDRMRGLLRTDSFPAALTGSIILAVAANSYELLCTAGFPMVYTRFLTMNSLSTASYYTYLALYNLVYMIPLAVIVTFFVLSLGSRKLTEWQGRVMKLVSGLMMFGLAAVLLLKPALLQSARASALLLLGVIVLSAVIVLVAGRLRHTADAKP